MVIGDTPDITSLTFAANDTYIRDAFSRMYLIVKFSFPNSLASAILLCSPVVFFLTTILKTL